MKITTVLNRLNPVILVAVLATNSLQSSNLAYEFLHQLGDPTYRIVRESPAYANTDVYV
ncbi:MAG: hypothetical protein AAFQ37_10220 [Bacteroidota bacterium]